jgi:hypothetical protein
VVDDPLQIVFCVADIDVGFGGGGDIQVRLIEKVLLALYP